MFKKYTKYNTPKPRFSKRACQALCLLNRGGVYSKICMKEAGVCLLNRVIY